MMAPGSGGSAETGLRRLAWWLFATGITLSFVLSAPALLVLGIPYDAPLGPPVAKLHPGSYLLVLAWGTALASHGNPLGVWLRQLARDPLLTASGACMVAVFVWVIWQQGTSGVAYIIETLWMPVIAAFALQLLAPRRGRQIFFWIMALLCVNSVLALCEYFLKARLVPIDAAQVGDDYFRSSALLGHPLLNASVTTMLLPALVLLPVRHAWHMLLGVLLLLAVLAFGGRTALGVCLAVYGLFGGIWIARGLVRGRYGYLALTGGSVALTATVAALALLALQSGLGDRIFQNLAWDNSASVRSRAWSAFDYLHDTDWWLGVPPAAIDIIELHMGLDPKYEAIENFWIYAFLQLGVIGFVPFVAGLVCLTAWMFNAATLPLRLGILVFFLVASTSNALTSKNVSLTLLATVVAANRTRHPRTVAADAHLRHSRQTAWGLP